MNSPVKTNEKSPNYARKYWWIGVCTLMIWASTIFFVPLFYEDVSSFGDMFGAVNALFSGLALAGIIITLIMQNRELVLQRRSLELQQTELALTRNELMRTANAQAMSSKAQTLTGAVQANMVLLELYREIAADTSGRLQMRTKLTNGEVNDGLEKTLTGLKRMLEELESLKHE